MKKAYFLLCFLAGSFILLMLTVAFVFAIFYMHLPVIAAARFLLIAAPVVLITKLMWDAYRGKSDSTEPEPPDSSGPDVPPYGV